MTKIARSFRTLTTSACALCTVAAATPAAAAGFGAYSPTRDLTVEETPVGLVIETGFYGLVIETGFYVGLVIETGFYGAVIEEGFYEGGGEQAMGSVALVGEDGSAEAIFRGTPVASGPGWVELADPDVLTPGDTVLEGQLVAVQLEEYSTTQIPDARPDFLMVVGSATTLDGPNTAPTPFAAPVGFGAHGGVELDAIFSTAGLVHGAGEAFGEPVLLRAEPSSSLVGWAVEAFAGGSLVGGSAGALKEQWSTYGVLDAASVGVWGTDGNLLTESGKLNVWGFEPELEGNHDFQALVGTSGAAYPVFLGNEKAASDMLMAALGVWGSNTRAVEQDPELAAWLDYAAEELFSIGEIGEPMELDGFTVVPLGDVEGIGLDQ